MFAIATLSLHGPSSTHALVLGRPGFRTLSDLSGRDRDRVDFPAPLASVYRL